MSKPIYVKVKVKVKYDQVHLYIVIFGIYRRCQAISIFDILIGFGVMAERLNPHVGIFLFFFFWVFFDPPGPHRQKLKILRTLSSNDLGFGGFCENLVEIGPIDPEIYGWKKREPAVK